MRVKFHPCNTVCSCCCEPLVSARLTNDKSVKFGFGTMELLKYVPSSDMFGPNR